MERLATSSRKYSPDHPFGVGVCRGIGFDAAGSAIFQVLPEFSSFAREYSPVPAGILRADFCPSVRALVAVSPVNSFSGHSPTALRQPGTVTRVSGPLFNPWLAVSNNHGGNFCDLPQKRGIRKEEIYVG